MDPYTFKRVWTECPFRVQNEYCKPCGAVQVHTICRNPEQERFMKSVNHPYCDACEVNPLDQ